jgi:Zn-dependent protease
MFTFGELSLFIFVLVVLRYGLTLFQFIIFLYYKFRLPNYIVIDRDTLDKHTLDVIKPSEEFLISEGFVFHTMIVHDSMIIGNEQKFHIAYYYNPSNNVHAFVKTRPFRGALEAANISYETFYVSKNVCTTLNGEKDSVPAIPEYVYLFDHYLSSSKESYKAHLNDRNIENEVVSKETFTRDSIIDYKNYDYYSYIEAFKSIGIAKSTEYGYRFVPSLALWKLASGSIKGYKKFSKILQNKQQGQTEQTLDDTQSQANGILTQLEVMEKPKGESNKTLWFSISLVAFIAFFTLLGLSIVDMALLVIVLLVHELGHYLAMRFFGYTDTSIFFLPFGAATIGKKERRRAFEEYIVFLAGPLPGILIGIGIIVSNIGYSDLMDEEGYLQMYAVMSLVINYINLLPIYPLDGGRILQTLLLLRYPKGQFLFYVVSLGILIVAMIWMQDPIMLIFVVLLGFGLKQSYRISQLLQTLSKREHSEINKEGIVNILVKDENYSKETLASKANIAKQVLHVLQTGKPSKVLVVFGLCVYLLFLTPPLIIVYVGIHSINDSEYSKLTPETKKKLITYPTDKSPHKE